MNTVVPLGPRHWMPTASQLKGIRGYCARIHGCRPQGIVIEVGSRYNVNDESAPSCMNILRVSSEDAWAHNVSWNDTDLSDTVPWQQFKNSGAPLNNRGRALLDFYVYGKQPGSSHGELLGNAQAYVDTINHEPTVIGFSGTGRAFESVATRPAGTRAPTP